jgi:hypothetical protein
LEDLKERDSTGIDGYNMKCSSCGCEVKIVVYGKLVAKPVKRRDADD